MTLNAPRAIPYDFRVFEMDEAVWLVDDSTRTYICSSTPVIWVEPLYWLDGERDEPLPEPNYYAVEVAAEAISLGMKIGPDVSEKEAWNDAREEACGNCRI